MKQAKLVLILVVLGVIGYLGYTHLASDTALKPVAEVTPPEKPMSRIEVSELVRDKCMSCHTRDLDLPFYASIPGIKSIIEKDYKDGLRAMDLREDFGRNTDDRPVNEATLAKMEWVTLHETMPPAKFTAVHWSSRVSGEERAAILDWVKSARATYYATGTAIPERANEPVQPIPDSLPTDAKKVSLGFTLFNDKRLSADDTISCHTCHDMEKAGTDNARFAEGIRQQRGDVNAPTVFNAVFNFRQFWDGRAATLHEQVAGPPFNPIEMGSADWQQVLDKLIRDEALTAEFTAVYPDGWTPNNIQDAITEYERTLITPDSPFDQWLKGRDDALSQAELDGYKRFKDYRCASCHVGKSLGGQSYEYMNLKKDYFQDRGGDPLGSDAGHKNFSEKDEHEHMFKVPNLRNIELTGPYLHDGTVATLDETVRIMGVYLAGIELPQQDRDNIVAFMRTLTGKYKGERLKGFVTPK